MNVYASEKVDFIKYETVFDLFKSMYNVCKMFNADEYIHYCYCNERGSQCFLCKFAKYVSYNEMENYLMIHRENEHKLLDASYKFWFYIMKIRRDGKNSHQYFLTKLKAKDEKNPLQFFDREYVWRYKNIKMPLDQVMKNDIIIFNEK